MTGTALSAVGLERVRGEWSRQLSVPTDAWRSPGTRYVAYDSGSVVMAVRLGATTVVVAPPVTLEALRSLDHALLLDVGALVVALGSFEPVPVGTAALRYRDRPLDGRPTGAVTLAEEATVHGLRARCISADWEESGLETMPRRWAALAPDGRAAALAGYEEWGTDVAHADVGRQTTVTLGNVPG